MPVFDKLKNSSRFWLTISAMIVFIGGKYGLELDPIDVYIAVVIIMNLVLGRSMSAIGSKVKEFQPTQEEKDILIKAKNISKTGINIHEAMELGERVILAKETVVGPIKSEKQTIENARALRVSSILIPLIFISSLAFAGPGDTSNYKCYTESPWWKALYDTVFNSQNPYDVGSAVGELIKYQCDPKIIRNGYEPNENCDPPPDCDIERDPVVVDTVPIIPSSDPSVSIVIPRIRLKDQIVVPTYMDNINELGDYLCGCNAFTMAVGEEQSCVAQGRLDRTPFWRADGEVLRLSAMQDTRLVTITALKQGTGMVTLGERLCANINVIPRTPSLQDQALEKAAELAFAEATQRERERNPSFFQQNWWWVTITGVVITVLTFKSNSNGEQNNAPIPVQ